MEETHTPPDTEDLVSVSTETWDAVLDGRVRFVQPARGYRVNQDSLLLAAFAATGRASDLAIDLGAGVGVVGLLLHELGAARRLALVECDPALSHFSERNLRLSGVPGDVFLADLTEGLPEVLLHGASLVVMNPPFFESERHVPKDGARRQARHGALAPFLCAASDALAGARARAAIAYPARALPELLQAAHKARLTPKRLRLVHPYLSRPARLALVELRVARPGGLVIEPPLIEWDAPGVRSPELSAIVGDRR